MVVFLVYTLTQRQERVRVEFLCYFMLLACYILNIREIIKMCVPGVGLEVMMMMLWWTPPPHTHHTPSTVPHHYYHTAPYALLGKCKHCSNCPHTQRRLFFKNHHEWMNVSLKPSNHHPANKNPFCTFSGSIFLYTCRLAGNWIFGVWTWNHEAWHWRRRWQWHRIKQ